MESTIANVSLSRSRPPSVLWLFALSSACNVIALLASHPTADPNKLDGDALEYFSLAGRILDGTYPFDVRRVPGHALILAGFRLFTRDNLVWLQTLVTLLFSTSAPAAYWLARRFTPREPIALSVGVATAFWPPFVIYGRTLYSETTALPCFLCFLASLPVEPAQGRSLASRPWRWMLSGALLGACMLIRPMYLFYAPLVPLILFFEIGKTIKTLLAVAWIALGCALALAPWSLYASVHSGRPVLLSSNGGETLAGGLNPELLRRGYSAVTAPDGRRTWVGPGKWLPEDDTGFLKPDELLLPRSERGSRLLERTLHWATSNPGSAAYLEGAKLAYMWGLYPFWNGLAQTLFGNIPILLAELGGLLAIERLRLAWRRLAMLWTLPLFASAVALVSWGSWRFREPADVGLIMLSAFFVWSRVEPGAQAFSAAAMAGRKRRMTSPR
ncbi:MAG: hypothetical protein ABSC94_03360 [Polyangiaceae bacterium]|jgi:hypothetical protein